MNEKDIKHLEWIFGRMRDIHGENENYDYMIRFREIIENQKKVNEILPLSGRLAMSAMMLIRSNAKDISKKVKALEVSLDEYDDEIVKQSYQKL